MKDTPNRYWRWVCCGLLIMWVTACDTERNVEDPDLSYFIKYYGADGNQRAVDMQVLSDGSMLLVGNSAVSDFDNNVYLLRVDAEGNVMWEKKIEEDVMYARDLEPTADGNFVVLADFRVDIGQQSDLSLIKISPDGEVLDSYDFGTVANDFSRTVTLLDDGGFMVSGTTELTSTYNLASSPDPDLGDIVNYRLDANLDPDPQWGPVSHGFGAHLDVAVRAVERTGGFYIFGYTNSKITGDLNPSERLGLFYFARDPSGSLGEVFYPGNVVTSNDTEIRFVSPVAPQLGTGYIVVGTSQNQIGISEIFFARMQASLNFGASDAPLYITIPLGRSIRGVAACSAVVGGAGYLVLGNEVRTTGARNMWLSKIDQSGRIIWSSTFGAEAEDDVGAAVAELPDGKIVVFGTVELADNQTKLALIKVNATGQLLK